MQIELDDIFPMNTKHLSSKYVIGLLEEHLSQLGINAVIATDASMSEEKANVGIFLSHYPGHIHYASQIIHPYLKRN